MDSSRGASRRGRSNSNKNAADAALNSSDDFENERVTRRGRPNAKLARKPQSKRKEVPSQEAARAKEEVQEPLTTSPKEPPKNFHPQPQVLRPCPMCGKNFQADQEAQRGNHLRQCGQHRGMTTEQLLQVRQLEEKQAKERAALGLPLHPVAAAPAAKQTKKASRKGAKNNAEKASAIFLTCCIIISNVRAPPRACADALCAPASARPCSSRPGPRRRFR